MVLVKVTVGGETRKFTLSDTATYDELRKKIANTFPSLNNKAQSLALFYKDEDGDTVSVSSDEEVIVAIATVPPNGTWKMAARLVNPPKKTPPTFTLIPSFSDILDFGSSPLLTDWHSSSRDLLRKREEFLQKLRKNDEETTKLDKESDENHGAPKKEEKDEPEVRSKSGMTRKAPLGSLWSDLEEVWSSVPADLLETINKGPLMREVAFGPTGFEMTWNWVHETKKSKEDEKVEERLEAGKSTKESPLPGRPLEEEEVPGETPVPQDVPTSQEVLSANGQ